MKIKRLGNAYCAVRLGTRPGDLLPVSETTFTAYLHSALKIQDTMLVVNDSCNMSWTDGNLLSSITLLSIFLPTGCGFCNIAGHGVECQAVAAKY